MESDGFFSWLGNAFGEAVRVIIATLRWLFGGLGQAIGDFSDGVANAIGMSPTFFNFALLVLGLLCLYSGVRAFFARSPVAGIIWLVIALFLLGGLIGQPPAPAT
ncbi:hypothetical protein V8Z80_14500 [Orrella sp. JC864]|uniref:hypothetical protein n=1 Tax=Orrella sp. JC864 TaxID=3120298 RepID=UPI0012BB4CE0